MSDHTHDGWSPRVRRVGALFRRDLARHSARQAPSLACPELTVSTTPDGDRRIIAVSGELDLASAWQLEIALRRAEATDAHEILLDLGGLQFIDSIGIQIVIHASDRSRTHGKRLQILSGPPSVHRAFELAGLASRLPFAERAEGVPLP